MSIYYEHFKSSIESNRKGLNYYNRFKVGDGIDDDIGTVYKAVLHQRGYGLRDFDEINGYGFWQDIWAMGRPLLSKGLKYLGSVGVDAVSNIARDALEGKNIKESTKERLGEVRDDIVAQVPGAIRSVLGSVSPDKYVSSDEDKRRGRKRKANSQRSAGAIVAAARKYKKGSGESFPGLKYF